MGEPMEQNIGNRKTLKYQLRALILLVMVLVIYILQNYLPLSFRNSYLFLSILKPALWITVIVVGLSFPKTRPRGKVRLNDLLWWYTILFAAAYILVMLISGMLVGFGKSPYDHSLTGIVRNIITVFSYLIGREIVRDYLINNRANRNYLFNMFLVTILMTAVDLSVDNITQLRTKLDIVTHIGEIVLPELSNNIFASYLVLMGGPWLSVTYLGAQQCFYWFFPILPNIAGSTKAFIGTLCPFFSYLILQYIYSKEAKVNDDKHAQTENPIGWVLTSVISISIVWFAAGVFPVRPLVIATGSMEPVMYAGDMVLVKRVNAKDLKVGDIIQYKRDNVFIFHRIIEIVEEIDGTAYRTKGDNNTIPDPELVKTESIRGIVFYTIPKVGWPTLWLKSDKQVDRSTVEF